jgi:hypothetical protein
MQNDEMVIQGIFNKDRYFLEILYDKYINHIYHIVKKILVDPSNIEKVITEIFRVIWVTPESLRKDTRLSVAITKLSLESCKTTT